MIYLLTKYEGQTEKIFGLRLWSMNHEQYHSHSITMSEMPSCPAWPDTANKHFNISQSLTIFGSTSVSKQLHTYPSPQVIKS